METNNKLRGVLEKISLLSSAPPPHWKPVAVIVEIGKLADAALAAPPRNCDVGTIVEQYKRFKKFCFDNMGDGMDEDRCCKCPLCKTGSSCRFAWSQMQYEEGGEK